MRSSVASFMPERVFGHAFRGGSVPSLPRRSLRPTIQHVAPEAEMLERRLPYLQRPLAVGVDVDLQKALAVDPVLDPPIKESAIVNIDELLN